MNWFKLLIVTLCLFTVVFAQTTTESSQTTPHQTTNNQTVASATTPHQTQTPETTPQQTQTPETTPHQINNQTEASATTPHQTQTPETTPHQTNNQTEASATTPQQTQAPQTTNNQTEAPQTTPQQTQAPQTTPQQTQTPQPRESVEHVNFEGYRNKYNPATPTKEFTASHRVFCPSDCAKDLACVGFNLVEMSSGGIMCELVNLRPEQTPVGKMVDAVGKSYYSIK